MKKILGMFLWLAMSIALTGCIIDFTPKQSVVELQSGETQTFKAVSDDPSAKLVWFLDGTKVAYGQSSYTYTAELVSGDYPAVHGLTVREEGGKYVKFYKLAGLPKNFMPSVTWVIKVTKGQEPACVDGETQATTCGVGACAATGIETCLNGQFSGNTCVPGTPTTEISDGIDNDCDGQIDEGVICVEGTTRNTTCGVGACAATGIETCVNGQFAGNTCVPATPTAEICDGIDNDCNGAVDNGIATTPTTCGIGACARTGVLACTNGAMIDSCAAGTPTAEICDGIDNNCNGSVDDGIASSPTTCGVGACQRNGESSCVNGATVNSCQPGTPSTEIGDGIDNDCDGQVDEGVACVEGATHATTCGVGACVAAGIETCVNGQFTGNTCVAGTPAAEVCDGIDNDCNGAVDNGIASTPTTCGVGACIRTGVLACTDGAMIDSCQAGTPTAEICDGIDNDCNGSVDDGIASSPTTCGVGACQRNGESSCVNGATVNSCQPGTPSTEIGDGIDNDCDGQVDEGVACIEGATHATTCGVGACVATGIETCVNGQFTGNTCVAGTPAAEVCDGIDNDCNGAVDNGIASTSTTCGVGACIRTGVLACTDGAMIDSCQAGTPTAELCDGIDNDCNGSVDDGIASSPTTCGVGACQRNGESSCVNGATVNSCQPGSPSTEIGDGIDNDCDGQVDEGVACMEGATHATTCGVGACVAAGIETCVNGQFTGNTCVAGTPTAEVCDGIDNDCNGAVDNGIATTPTTCGVGACARTGAVACTNGAMIDSCQAGTPTAELCDGIDNNCNGTTDDGIASIDTTCGVGACASTGVSSCVNGAMSNSCQAGTPSAETCDGIDNNCNGTTDDGIASTPTNCGVGACVRTGALACVNGAMSNSCVAGTPGPIEICANEVDDNCDGLTDGADTVTCGGPVIPPPPTNVKATDLDTDLATGDARYNVTVTWNASAGATYYNVYRSVYYEDGDLADYVQVNDASVIGTSFVFEQNFEDDFWALVGPNPTLPQNATNAIKIAFLANLKNYRMNKVEPALAQFKTPSYYKVQACNANGCNELAQSVADFGQPDFIHTATYSEVTQISIMVAGELLLKMVADIPSGTDGAKWCGLDVCGDDRNVPGGIVMGRLFADAGVFGIIDWMVEYRDYINGIATLPHPDATIKLNGTVEARMELATANDGIYNPSGDISLTFFNNITVNAHAQIFMNLNELKYPDLGHTQAWFTVTYNGVESRYTMPIPPAAVQNPAIPYLQAVRSVPTTDTSDFGWHSIFSDWTLDCPPDMPPTDPDYLTYCQPNPLIPTIPLEPFTATKPSLFKWTIGSGKAWPGDLCLHNTGAKGVIAPCPLYIKP